MPSLFKRDSKGFAAVLVSERVAQMVHDTTEGIASQVRAQQADADVVVDDYTTDRAASSVTIRDVNGKLWQVRDGILTRAAAAQGLEVRERR